MILLTVWSSVWNPSSLWIWESLEVVGAIIVTIGVIGEYVSNFTKWAKGRARKKLWEKRSTLVLIAGLAIELVGLVNALISSNIEIRQLHNENKTLFAIGETAKASADRAKESVEKAEAGRLELEKQVLALIDKTKVRNISPIAITNLAFNLRRIEKGNVEVIMSDRDAECMAFGLEIKKTLLASGFSDVGFSPRDIFRAVEMFPEAANSGTDLIFCVQNSSSPPLCSVITLSCFSQGGINASGWPYNVNLGTNDFQIWVLPKPVRSE
jgi:hypothetical protein